MPSFSLVAYTPLSLQNKIPPGSKILILQLQLVSDHTYPASQVLETSRLHVFSNGSHASLVFSTVPSSYSIKYTFCSESQINVALPLLSGSQEQLASDQILPKSQLFIKVGSQVPPVVPPPPVMSTGVTVPPTTVYPVGADTTMAGIVALLNIEFSENI